MYDIAIIGGGINGCGIARDAAGRGYSVLLGERGDLAQGTSSGSTKLIHGGLRYLEHYEFRLVRAALQEREVLWSIAPHVIWPMRFVLPYAPGMRPAWLLRAGLFVYDHIGKRKRLAATRALDLRTDKAGEPLQPGFGVAFEYSDCWVDDARLVVLNARDAANRGAEIRTRTSFERIQPARDHWVVSLRDERTGEVSTIKARLIVNAAGPWVDDVLCNVAGKVDAHNIRLVQGSHIVVPRLFDHNRSYIFQNADGRVIFAIPYEQDFTLIGTTDRDFEGALDDVRISKEEIDYLCGAASQYFKKQIDRDDIVWSYSAVRPLLDGGAGKAHEATREYVLKLERSATGTPLINIFGGKITSYRRLAEAVLDQVDGALGWRTARWSGGHALPGGDFDVAEYDTEVAQLMAAHPYLDDRTGRRLVRSYGTVAHEMFAGVGNVTDLGESFGAGLSEREVDYLRANEWAESADDILWRRSKLGLRLSSEERERLANWISQRGGVSAHSQNQ